MSQANAKDVQVQQPCPQIQIESTEKIDLSKTEHKWICGDNESHAWKQVPAWQAQLFLKSFLQQRAFHQPQFEIRDNTLFVKTGPQTYLKKWTFENAPLGFHAEKRRKLKGRPLTPELLDEVEAWSKAHLQNLGYPCPEVHIQAMPLEESVTVTLIPGELYNFPTTDVEVRGTQQQLSIGRYSAFLPGQKFDARLLQLTSNRMLLDEYHLSAYFETQCTSGAELKIVPRLVTGDPQLISAGVGFNTEVGAIAQIRYKQSQLDSSGSTFESKLFLSFIEQTWDNAFQLYGGPPYKDRTFWSPQLNLKNELEDQYQSFTAELGLEWGLTKEFDDFTSRFQLGPFYTYNNVVRDSSNTVLLSATSNVELYLQSHDYEYYMGEPRSGWQLSSNLRSAYENLGADQTFHQWLYQQQNLWNFNLWDPPLMVFGWRFKAGTFFMSDDSQFFSVVPENLRFYLGGDGTLRGFSRKQIPLSQLGSATFIYQGFELRAGDVFPFKLQPFVFLDMGWESSQIFTLSRTLYYSPGLGLRWPSFLGPIRASLSQGQILFADNVDVEPHWQFYLSLGREF
ncbi:BamA/TamA family outer membrane protein [Bdellovibrio sp. ArHS]|uniref:BamA/TamA family outer membrane protein n=1 Tax=Bdellovibrio sp. ArHS TaxID=1569284 RepID=UPI0025C220A8|nr:BamA/TamA family outer membrane protein [Bdellovibrio sp. ArHS]